MATNKTSYAEAIAEVEKILERIQNEEVDVDTLAAEVKRASDLLAACRKKLVKSEQELGKIFES